MTTKLSLLTPIISQACESQRVVLAVHPKLVGVMCLPEKKSAAATLLNLWEV